MARQKRVLMVSIAEHGRIVQRLRDEVAAWRAVAEASRSDIDELRETVESMMSAIRRVLRHRRRLRQNPELVVAACGREDCGNMIIRPHGEIGNHFRRCDKCTREAAASFITAREALFRASPVSPVSPSTFLARDSDNEPESDSC